MLDFADVVAINKFERRGAMDALRDVGRQMVRNRGAFGKKPEDMPVFGTSAATFNDDGVTALYQELRGLLADAGLEVGEGALAPVTVRHSSVLRQVVPPQRVRYLAEIAETVRGYHDDTRRYAEAARRVQRLTEVGARARAGRVRPHRGRRAARPTPRTTCRSRSPASSPAGRRSSRPTRVTSRWSPCATGRSTPHWCGSRCPATGSAGCRCPRYSDDGDLVSFLRRENLPGYFPFTAGVFPFKRDNEDPARMFAGEGDPFRTNRRFKMLSQGQPATRLSTAFDSVTLYGRDPDKRPDIYGKVGTSGVSVATLDDMRELYAGFDLTSPTTSVSMTINGPAPTILAFFLNTVMDRAVEAWVAEHGREPERAGGARHPGAGPAGGARHGAGRHPQGGPGPEHLPVLHGVLAADDGRHPGVVHRAAGAQLLLGVDQRLPHRRGRGEPDQPARVHPRQRVHLRRGLPRARHGHRRLRPEPVVLLLQRHGPRVHRHRPGGPPRSGPSR